MSDYTPDKWLVVKITGPDTPPVHKVFACWYGGYLGSDSWKLNSGITKMVENGSSGSTYACHKATYGASSYGYGILENMVTKALANNITIEVLPEETNWLEINYE